MIRLETDQPRSYYFANSRSLNPASYPSPLPSPLFFIRLQDGDQRFGFLAAVGAQRQVLRHQRHQVGHIPAALC